MTICLKHLTAFLMTSLKTIGTWFCWLLFPAVLLAQERPVFEVNAAALSLSESMLMLNSKLSIRLPDYIAMAINQGFAVPLSFEVEILERRDYWFDEKLVSLKQQYLVHYLPMLDSYVVTDINQSERQYFDDRDHAVNSLKFIYHYPIFDIDNISPELDVYARLRFGVDADELPLPLKSSSLWDNDWALQSEWYDWDFDRPAP